jgi:hypothetical protein
MAPGSFPIEDAPEEGRALLGALLAQRRKELGYTHWPAFARDRLPPTPAGNPNTRLLADIEKAYRARFPEPTLRQLAAAYMVTYESLVAVAHLKRQYSRDRLLVPVPGRQPGAVPAEPPPPIADPAHVAADRPRFDEINERRVALAARGITDPSGSQMFPDDPQDAQTWDGIGARLDIRDRVWLIADLRRRAAARGDRSGTGTEAP